MLLESGMDEVEIALNGFRHLSPTAGVDDAKNRYQKRPQPDQKELDHFVEYGGDQAAESDIDGHRQRSHPDA